MAEVIVDHRERGSGVPERLRELGVDVRFEYLDVGDYLVDREKCIERKTANDLVNSIIDKRLFEQARYMARSFSKPIIVIEGSIDDVIRYRKIGISHLYGAIAALMDMGLYTMFTADKSGTAHFIYIMARRSERERRRYLPPSKIRVVRSSRSIPVIQLNIVSSIPGISVELAHRILEYFKTPRRFFRASVQEIKRIPGLGEKRARRIVEVLDTVYNPELVRNHGNGG